MQPVIRTWCTTARGGITELIVGSARRLGVCKDRYLDVEDEGPEALHLAVRPPRDAELAAALLEHGEPHVHLPRRLGDGHVEVLPDLLEADMVQPCLPRRLNPHHLVRPRHYWH